MLRALVKLLKKLPIDLGQYEMRYSTKGKLIAYGMVPTGAQLRPAATALDVGCRDAYWPDKLTRSGYAVTACDFAPQYSGAQQLDANRPLPFATDAFDLVWCSEVIEHLTEPALAIAEFKRVLRPGGSLIMTTPNMGFWLFRLMAALGISVEATQNEDHHFFFTYADMGRLVGPCTFYGYFPYFLLKWRIQALAALLSPTIVLHHINAKPAAPVVL